MSASALQRTRGIKMKQILITGAGSYIGTSLERYLREYNEQQGEEWYRADTISLREKSWENYDFSCYSSVFHVAGMAHADVGSVSEETKAQYYQVNCDLAVRTAKRAKAQGVKQFIYMSSIIVYGDSAPVGKTRRITADTKPAPSNFYGDSKLQAEKGLQELEDKHFKVAILRPPMIYGKGSKGNYPLLSKIAGRLPVFPDIQNQRSMLYVENLAEFVRLLAEDGRGGVFFPQNGEYTTTSQMVKAIGNAKGKKVHLWKILNPLVHLAARAPGKAGGMTNKAFGSLTVEPSLSCRDFEGYQKYSLEESVRRTEA